jgi:hypothetical protein
MIASAAATSPLVELKEKKTNKIPNAPTASLQQQDKVANFTNSYMRLGWKNYYIPVF